MEAYTLKQRKWNKKLHKQLQAQQKLSKRTRKRKRTHVDDLEKKLHFLMTNVSDTQLCDISKHIKRIHTRCRNAVWNVYGTRILNIAFYTEYLYYDDLCALHCVHKDFTKEGETRVYTRKLAKSTFVNTSKTTANDALRKAIKMWLDYTENKGYTPQDTAKKMDMLHISEWNTQYVTNMECLFKNADRFNEPLNWNTRNVTSMSCMFESATNFNQPLAFDTSNVTNMEFMFAYASSFNQPLAFDTSNVTNMDFMFAYASSFNQPLAFDTSNVTNMVCMFADATSFNQPLAFDTRNVTAMCQMFLRATSFNQPLAFDISNATNIDGMIDGMFSGATSFNQSNWKPNSPQPP